MKISEQKAADICNFNLPFGTITHKSILLAINIIDMKKQLVILSGAGMSAESGLSTFRDQDGLWEKYRVEDVCTPEALYRKSSAGS
jgi:NAD-dependent protein deacetylases, SIR2 family